MRVIEPRRLQHHHKKVLTKRVTVTVLAIVIILVGNWYITNRKSTVSSNRVLGTNQSNNSTTGLTSTSDGTLRYFSGPQFQELIESLMLAYPNIERLTTAPSITGNEVADQRIRTIAESRGYVLRAVPTYPIKKAAEISGDVDNLLQPRAYSDWQNLKAKAKQANIPLKLVSGYRSINWQRTYFLKKMSARGITIPHIISGKADDAIVDVLHVVAPPGYSRHHTGYTIDLWCEDGSLSFKHSRCFAWLKANNYQVAKDTGWVPSYPEDADDQGPEPEAWEYVWAGRSQLTN